MIEYPKTPNLLKRGNDHKIIRPYEFSKPVFSWLRDCQWKVTEKIDGTNVRIIVSDTDGIQIRGRTDRAQMPTQLLKTLGQLVAENEHQLRSLLLNCAIYTIYGEGFGAGINGNHQYGDECQFRAFAVRGHRTWWPSNLAYEKIVFGTTIQWAPIYGDMTLAEALDHVAMGSPSALSKRASSFAEGLVLTPSGCVLLDEYGDRVICKIKTKDVMEA